VRRTIPAAFTASETFDVGMDTSSPVAERLLRQGALQIRGKAEAVFFKNLKEE
jgi:hypothetical protein